MTSRERAEKIAEDFMHWHFAATGFASSESSALEKQLAANIAAAIDEAVAEAFQEAAKVADGVDSTLNPDEVRWYAKRIAEMIRARRKP